jgi:hypothetical protein
MPASSPWPGTAQAVTGNRAVVRGISLGDFYEFRERTDFTFIYPGSFGTLAEIAAGEHEGAPNSEGGDPLVFGRRVTSMGCKTSAGH